MKINHNEKLLVLNIEDQPFRIRKTGPKHMRVNEFKKNMFVFYEDKCASYFSMATQVDHRAHIIVM